METYGDGPSFSCLVLTEDEPHLVAEHPTAVGDRDIGGHRSVRAPVVAVWVIADADGRLQQFATSAQLLQMQTSHCQPILTSTSYEKRQICKRGQVTNLIKTVFMVAVSALVAAVPLVLLIFIVKIPAGTRLKTKV